MKTTHTHRGTCQACGKDHAIDNASGLVAKHGYKVIYGEFQFVCNASGYKPAEHDVTYTHSTIAYCLEAAKSNELQVDALKKGNIVPKTFQRWNPEKIKQTKSRYSDKITETKGDYDTLPIKQATADERKHAIESAIAHYEGEAAGFRAHAGFLKGFVLPRLGQPLYATDVKPKYDVGFTFESKGVKFTLVRPAYSVYGGKRIGWYVERGDNNKIHRWSTRSLNEAINPKPAKVSGGYDTKAARKRDLEKLNRQYVKVRRQIQDVFCEVPHEVRTEAQNKAYYSIPYDLHQWRAKHGATITEMFPQTATLVEEITKLYAKREEVKAAPGA